MMRDSFAKNLRLLAAGALLLGVTACGEGPPQKRTTSTAMAERSVPPGNEDDDLPESPEVMPDYCSCACSDDIIQMHNMDGNPTCEDLRGTACGLSDKGMPTTVTDCSRISR